MVYDYRVMARNEAKASLASPPSAPVRVKREKQTKPSQQSKGELAGWGIRQTETLRQVVRNWQIDRGKERQSDTQTVVQTATASDSSACNP